MNYTNSSAESVEPIFQYLGLFSGLLLLIVCLMGLAGNLVSMLIFCQRHFLAVSINILLFFLSFADFCLLFFAIPVFVPAPLATYFQESAFLDALYKRSLVYVFPVVAIFQTSSIWLLTVITYERWLAVCRPFLATVHATGANALIAAFVIFFLSICYNVVRFWDFELQADVMLLLRESELYNLWYLTVSWQIVVYALPLSIISVLTLFSMSQLKKSDKERTKITRSEWGSRRTSRMLGAVVLVFVSCYSLSFTLNLVEIARPQWFVSDLGIAISDLNNVLAVFNSASTALLYYKFSTRYRRTLSSLVTFICACGKDVNLSPNRYSILSTLALRRRKRQKKRSVIVASLKLKNSITVDATLHQLYDTLSLSSVPHDIELSHSLSNLSNCPNSEIEPCLPRRHVTFSSSAKWIPAEQKRKNFNKHTKLGRVTASNSF